MGVRGDHVLIESRDDSPDCRKQAAAYPIAGINRDTLEAFFKDGYGSAYLGDERLYRKIDRSSHVVLLEDTNKKHGIAGAALVAGRRILAMATSPDEEYRGNRHNNAVLLLHGCFDELGCQWLTVGAEYARVQAVLADAEMYRINSEELVRGLLAEADETNSYAIRYDEQGGLLVVRTVSVSRPDYAQQFWVHLPCSEG